MDLNFDRPSHFRCLSPRCHFASFESVLYRCQFPRNLTVIDLVDVKRVVKFAEEVVKGENSRVVKLVVKVAEVVVKEEKSQRARSVVEK